MSFLENCIFWKMALGLQKVSVGARPTQAEQLYWVLKVLTFFDTLLQDFSIDEHSPNACLLSPTQNKRFTVPIGYGEPFKKTIHKLLVFIRKQVEQHWTLYRAAHSSVPIRPAIWLLFIGSGIFPSVFAATRLLCCCPYRTHRKKPGYGLMRNLVFLSSYPTRITCSYS